MIYIAAVVFVVTVLDVATKVPVVLGSVQIETGGSKQCAIILLGKSTKNVSHLTAHTICQAVLVEKRAGVRINIVELVDKNVVNTLNVELVREKGKTLLLCAPAPQGGHLLKGGDRKNIGGSATHCFLYPFTFL